MQEILIYYSYDSQDEPYFQKLQNQLAPLRRRYPIIEWDRSQIQPGTDRQKEHSKNLNNASLIIFLIGPEFLSSEAHYQEIQLALARKGVPVIPVILRPCAWEISVLGRLQYVPRNKVPVTMWNNKDAAFAEIAQSIQSSVERLLQQQADDDPEATLVKDKPGSKKGISKTHSRGNDLPWLKRLAQRGADRREYVWESCWFSSY